MSNDPSPTDAWPPADSLADPRGLIQSWSEPASESAASKIHRPRRQSRLTREQLLHSPLPSLVILLALPSLAEQMLNFLVGTVDVILAGHLPGEGVSRDATEAVGLAAYVGWLATMLFAIVGAGTTALISRAAGAGDESLAQQVANRSLWLALLMGGATFAGIWLVAPFLADLLGMQGSVREITIHYLRFDAIGLIFASVSLAGSAALRGMGDMRTPMWILGGVNLLNAIVSPLCVFGIGPIPAMGVDGIVLGTVAARILGGVAIFACFATGRQGLMLNLAEFRLRGDVTRRILEIGFPAAVDGLIMWIGHLIFLKIVRQTGEASFAAHVIGVRIEALTYLPAIAWGAAAATLVGQSLGARRPDRAQSAAWSALRHMSLVGLLLTLVYYAGADVIFRAMSNDAEVRMLGPPALRLLALFQLPLAVSVVVLNALRGAGETRFPMWITLLGGFGLRLPLAWVCGITLGGGLVGAWIGMCGDMLFRAVLLLARFIQGGWLHKKV